MGLYKYIYITNIYTLPDIEEINIFRFGSEVILALKKLSEVSVNISLVDQSSAFQLLLLLHDKVHFVQYRKKNVAFFSCFRYCTYMCECL